MKFTVYSAMFRCFHFFIIFLLSYRPSVLVISCNLSRFLQLFLNSSELFQCGAEVFYDITGKNLGFREVFGVLQAVILQPEAIKIYSLPRIPIRDEK